MEGNTGQDNNKFNLMQTLQEKFKPNLLTRILFDGGAHNIMKGGASPTKSTVLKGGLRELDNKEIPGFMGVYLARAMVFFFLLFLSYYFAIKVMGQDSIRSGIYKGSGLDDVDASWSKKYRRTLLYLLVFLLFTTLFYWGFTGALWLMVYGYVSTFAKPGEEIGPVVSELWDRLFYKFVSKEGYGNIEYVNMMIRFAVWGVFIIFIIYMLFVRSFVNNMSYPLYMEEDDPNERSTERKLLVFFSIVSLLVFISMVVIFCCDWAWPNDIPTVLIGFVVIGFYSLLVSIVFRYELKKDNTKVAIYMIMLFALVFLHYMTLGGI